MIQGTVNRKVCLPASAVVIGYQYYVERVFRVDVGDSFCSIFWLALVISSQCSRLITRSTTNADPKLYVHKNYSCTGPETKGETYLMSETTYFCIFCSVQNPHPCDGQVEHVSSHPTEILVSLTIYTSYAVL